MSNDRSLHSQRAPAPDLLSPPEARQALMQVDGVRGAALIDAQAGRILVSLRVEDEEDLELAADGPGSGPGDADGVADALDLDEDRVIVLDDEDHLVRAGPTHEALCYYLVLERGDNHLERARQAIDRTDARLDRD